jgi:hypothetical protein
MKKSVSFMSTLVRKTGTLFQTISGLTHFQGVKCVEASVKIGVNGRRK